MIKAVDERRTERRRLIARARAYAERLDGRIPLKATILVGSVARGDFNVWSDIDVLVVADELPERTPDRGLLLMTDAPAGVQPVGMTPSEFRSALERRNRMVVEAVESGIVLSGELPGPELG